MSWALNIRNLSASYSKQKPVFRHWSSGDLLIDRKSELDLQLLGNKLAILVILKKPFPVFLKDNAIGPRGFSYKIILHGCFKQSQYFFRRSIDQLIAVGC